MEQIELQQLRILSDLIVSQQLQIKQMEFIVKDLRLKLLEVKNEHN
jgi:hypothetical protein